MVQTQIIIIVTIIAIIIDPWFIESRAERPRSEDKDKEQLITQLLQLNKTQCSDERCVYFKLELKSICRQIRLIIPYLYNIIPYLVKEWASLFIVN